MKPPCQVRGDYSGLRMSRTHLVCRDHTGAMRQRGSRANSPRLRFLVLRSCLLYATLERARAGRGSPVLGYGPCGHGPYPDSPAKPVTVATPDPALSTNPRWARVS